MPTMPQSMVPIVSPVSGWSSPFARPKSMIFGTAWPWISVTSTFDGFRSRWITAFWCAWPTPSQTARKSSSRFRSESVCSSQYFRIPGPGTYSIAMYGRPSSVLPAS